MTKKSPYHSHDVLVIDTLLMHYGYDRGFYIGNTLIAYGEGLSQITNCLVRYTNLPYILHQLLCGGRYNICFFKRYQRFFISTF